MKRKKAILLSISGVLIICIICLIGAALLTNQMDKQSYYVYCELLKPGISLSEAEKGFPVLAFIAFQKALISTTLVLLISLTQFPLEI